MKSENGGIKAINNRVKFLPQIHDKLKQTHRVLVLFPCFKSSVLTDLKLSIQFLFKKTEHIIREDRKKEFN